MLTDVLAHDGAPVAPHDVLGAWNLDPLLLGGLGVLALVYRRGRRPGPDGGVRTAAFWTAVGAVVVAVVSPLDAVSGSLASAHMIQHVLLVLVAAPLMAFSAPSAALLRGSPTRVRRWTRSVRRAAGLGPSQLRSLRAPVWRWVVYVVTFWLWHASVLYGAAVEYEAVHVAEHVTFFVTAYLVWSVIVGPARARVPRGLGIVGVFTLALQSVFLSALLTFARSPWYEPYLSSTSVWGLDPLADQQLAGVVMWIPAGLIHAGIGLALFVGWFREFDDPVVVEH